MKIHVPFKYMYGNYKRNAILINSELFTLSKRNDGAVLAPVNDFTKNSRQSSNLSLIAAI